jgi:hypothetical protein
MNYYNDGENQFFNSCVIGLIITVKYCFKMLIYSPFLLTGYLISKAFLHRSDHVFLWMGMTLLVAYIFYIFISILKKLINIWRAENKFYWIPLFIICVAFTCILPVYLVFEPLEKIIGRLTHGSNVSLITWIFSMAFGFYVYSRHRFFRNQ